MSKSKAKKNREDHSRSLKIKRGAYCEKCGYNKNLSALTWHHRNPDDKVNEVGHMPTFELVEKEAEKCDLLCKNCHTEEHSAQFNIIPLTLADANELKWFEFLVPLTGV